MSHLELAAWIMGVVALSGVVLLVLVIPSNMDLVYDRDILLEITDCELLKEYGLQFKHFSIRDYIMDECYKWPIASFVIHLIQLDGFIKKPRRFYLVINICLICDKSFILEHTEGEWLKCLRQACLRLEKIDKIVKKLRCLYWNLIY